jgi:hypothetical protein
VLWHPHTNGVEVLAQFVDSLRAMSFVLKKEKKKRTPPLLRDLPFYKQ